MVEHVFELYCASSAIFTFAFLALASRAADGHPMIELPHEFLNAVFGAVIANVRRLRNRLRGRPDVRERS
jgi:hypothetical protein